MDFVRINGNRVIRVEVAKMGETPEIFTKDEVQGMMRTDGSPLTPNDSRTRTVAFGDAERNPDTQSAAAPPSLRAPGETVPEIDKNKNAGAMKPVQFPKPKPADQPGANPDGEPAAQPAASAPQPDASQPSPSKPQATPASSTQPN